MIFISIFQYYNHWYNECFLKSFLVLLYLLNFGSFKYCVTFNFNFKNFDLYKSAKYNSNTSQKLTNDRKTI